jgi:hypothetical protein
MTKGPDADVVAEVLSGHIGENLAGDVVLLEEKRVLAETLGR